MTDKIYKTYRQLLNVLRSRGMEIKKGSQGSRVMRVLEKENYYNVINGYKDLFLLSKATATTEEVYRPNTSFDEIYALYTFDREVRHIYLKYLLKIENMFKTVIAHEFSAKYGHDNYLKLENFHSTASTDAKQLAYTAKKLGLTLPQDLAKVQQKSAEENAAGVIKLIGDIQQEIARQISKNNDVVIHYTTTYGYIPLWVLVNVLTFGKITYFYQYMKPAEKNAVAKKFDLQPIELHKYMEILGLARNKCAHDERFFNIRFRRSLHTRSIKNFSKLGLERKSDGSYQSGTNDAYAVAIIFAQLLSKAELKEFISSMKDAIGKLERQLYTIDIEDVLNNMGYGKTWTKLMELKR